MKHFKSTIEFKEIYNECKYNNTLNQKAKFNCLVDGLMEYELIDNDYKYVFTIWADMENWLNEMEVSWLLDLKRIEYFQHSIYQKNNNNWELVDSREFRYLDPEEWN